jgi:hypothetical protein
LQEEKKLPIRMALSLHRDGNTEAVPPEQKSQLFHGHATLFGFLMAA